MKAQNKIVVSVFVSVAVCLCASWASAKGRFKQCPILDQAPDSVYRVSFGYIPDSDATEGGGIVGSTDIIEVNGEWAFAYFRDVAHGNIDLNLQFEGTVFHDSLDDRLPSQVGRLALDAGWALRSERGLAFVTRLAPGLYSDFQDLGTEAVYCPVAFSLVRTFRTDFAGMFGVEIRSGFDRVLIPLVGIVWEPDDRVRVDLRCPSSRISWLMSGQWRTHLGLDWENTSYALDDRREKLTLDYFRAYWGLGYQVSTQLQLAGELGSIFQRSIDFDEDVAPSSDDLDVDDSWFLRLSASAPF